MRYLPSECKPTLTWVERLELDITSSMYQRTNIAKLYHLGVDATKRSSQPHLLELKYLERRVSDILDESISSSSVAEEYFSYSTSIGIADFKSSIRKIFYEGQVIQHIF